MPSKYLFFRPSRVDVVRSFEEPWAVLTFPNVTFLYEVDDMLVMRFEDGSSRLFPQGEWQGYTVYTDDYLTEEVLE